MNLKFLSSGFQRYTTGRLQTAPVMPSCHPWPDDPISGTESILGLGFEAGGCKRMTFSAVSLPFGKCPGEKPVTEYYAGEIHALMVRIIPSPVCHPGMSGAVYDKFITTGGHYG